MSINLIRSDPNVLMGKPVIAGTRIPVDLILEKLAAGETFAQIIQAHPRLTEDAIRAALDFAAKAIKADVVYPVWRNCFSSRSNNCWYCFGKIAGATSGNESTACGR